MKLDRLFFMLVIIYLCCGITYAVPIIQDNFDDGDAGVNTNGIGSGFHSLIQTTTSPVLELGGVLRLGQGPSSAIVHSIASKDTLEIGASDYTISYNFISFRAINFRFGIANAGFTTGVFAGGGNTGGNALVLLTGSGLPDETLVSASDDLDGTTFELTILAQTNGNGDNYLFKKDGVLLSSGIHGFNSGDLVRVAASQQGIRSDLDSVTVDSTLSSVPEPSTFLLIGLGLFFLSWNSRH